MKRTLWLRSETKPFEERVALTPDQARILLEEGHNIIVEDDPHRVFKTIQYEEVGCEIVPRHSWIQNAPEDATILGLKELAPQDFPLKRRHIHFAHIYKGQEGSKEVFRRFQEGGGLLFDLEYLTDQKGKRVAAFGIWAGFTGAALGLELWLSKRQGLDMNARGPLTSYPTSQTLSTELKDRLGNEKPKVLIIGAKGRCGKGARRFFESVGLEVTGWGRKETQGKKRIKEILDYDIFINCALMTEPLGAWLTPEMLDGSQRLSVLSDVSCDPTGPCNPVPVYPGITTMDRPAYHLESKNFSVTSIDHLPSLLPKESSEDFSAQLFPHLLEYMRGNILNSPWERSLNLFYKNLFKNFPEEDEGPIRIGSTSSKVFQ